MQLPCPVCHTPYTPQETTCITCGLVLSSPPPALTTLPTTPHTIAPAAQICPQCGQSAQPGAVACTDCGAPLTFAYQPLQPGQTMANGAYTIQCTLSKGGMGTIYLATDHHAFDRTVVIKAMLDYFDPSNPQEVQAARDRFVQEAHTLSTLRHPTIPQIYTYFRDGPHNYIVMEYIEGSDLAQGLTHSDEQSGERIQGTCYKRHDVLRWGVALCRVLEYLASREPHPVVHHDIKPANLLLDSSTGDIRLVDFGTAKARLLVQSGGVGLHKSSVFGTQGYAPPEQYQGQSEPRSDVYALAATLYHLATDDDPGTHPFHFPRLKEQGALGGVLAQALHMDAAKRPSATVMRQLFKPRVLVIASVASLVGWALGWLYVPLAGGYEGSVLYFVGFSGIVVGLLAGIVDVTRHSRHYRNTNVIPTIGLFGSISGAISVFLAFMIAAWEEIGVDAIGVAAFMGIPIGGMLGAFFGILAGFIVLLVLSLLEKKHHLS